MNSEQLLGAVHAHHEVQSDEGTVLTAINSTWQFAAIIQFCRVFSEQLGVTNFSAFSLERALIDSQEQASKFWDDLVPQLLSRGLGQQAVGSWESCLGQLFSNAQVWQSLINANPLAHKGFYDVSALSKIAVLHALCEWILRNNAAIRNAMSQQVSKPDASLLDLLLSRPLGEDAAGASYYHLSGNSADLRVYKRLPGSGSHGQVQWATQCTALQQLQAWAAQLASGSDSKDQALYAALVQVLPKQDGNGDVPPPPPPAVVSPLPIAAPAAPPPPSASIEIGNVQAVPLPPPPAVPAAQASATAGTAAGTSPVPPPPPPPPAAEAAAADMTAAETPPPPPPSSAAAAAAVDSAVAKTPASTTGPADAAADTPAQGAAAQPASKPEDAADSFAAAEPGERSAAEEAAGGEPAAADAAAAAPTKCEHAAEEAMTAAPDHEASAAAEEASAAATPADAAAGATSQLGVDDLAAKPAAGGTGVLHDVQVPAAEQPLTTGDASETAIRAGEEQKAVGAPAVKPAPAGNAPVATAVAAPAGEHGTLPPGTPAAPTTAAAAAAALVSAEVAAAPEKAEAAAADAQGRSQAATEAMKTEAEAAAKVTAEAKDLAQLKAEPSLAAAQAATQQQHDVVWHQQQFEAARKQQLEQQQAARLQQQQRQQEAARQQAAALAMKQEQERREATAAAAAGAASSVYGAAGSRPSAAAPPAVPPSGPYPGMLQPSAVAGPAAADKAATVVPQQFTRSGRPRRAATVRGRKPQHGLGWSPLSGVLAPRRQKVYRPGPFRNIQRLVDVVQSGLDAIVIPGAHQGRGQAPSTRLAARPAAAATPGQQAGAAAGGVGVGPAGHVARVAPPAVAAAGGGVPGGPGMPVAAPPGVNPAVAAFARQLNPAQLQQFLSFPPAQQVAIAEERMRAYMAQQQAAAQQAAAQNEQQQQAAKRKKPVKKRRGWKKKRGPDYSDEDAEYNIENDSDFSKSESSSESSDDWDTRRTKRSKGRGRGKAAKKQKAEEPEQAARRHGMQMGRGVGAPGPPYSMAPGASGRPGMPGYGGMPGRPGMAPQQLLQQQQLLHQQQQMAGQQGGMYRPGMQSGAPGQMGAPGWPQQGQQQQQMLQQLQQMQGRQHMQQPQQLRPPQIGGSGPGPAGAPQVTRETINQVLSTLSGEERLNLQAIPDQARKMQYIIQLAQVQMQRQQQQQQQHQQQQQQRQQQQQMRPQGMMQQQPQQHMQPQYGSGGGFPGQQGMMGGGVAGGVNLFTGVQPGTAPPRPGMQMPGGVHAMSALGPGMSAVGPGGVNAAGGQNPGGAAAAMFAAQQQQQGMRPAGMMQHGQAGGWHGMQQPQQHGGDGLLPDTDSLFS